ncbi:hypothetical protein ACH5RR_025100 [Cinchona calisaya]|uniref:Uncharacterized protein n=1 Tax=Cinchona calisaya TaxID=153742 RepID=A0ABD2YYN0_9GENT
MECWRWVKRSVNTSHQTIINKFKELMLSLKLSSSSSASPPTVDLEADGEPADQPVPINNPGAPPYHFDWAAVVIGFCLTSTVEIALQSLQPQIKIPPLVHFLSLSLLFAFASSFVSTFVSPNFAGALILVSKICVLAAFFCAITIPFSTSLKIISWSIFGVCLLVIACAALTSSSSCIMHGN